MNDHSLRKDGKKGVAMFRPRRCSGLLFFLIPWGGLTVTAFLGSLLLPPQYEGRAKIAFAVNQRDTFLSPGTFYDPSSGRLTVLPSLWEVFQSRETAKRVWEKLHPQGAAISEREIHAFQKRIRVTSPPGYDPNHSDVLIIQVRDRDPETAARAANILPGEATTYAREREAEIRRRTLQLLEAKIRAQQEALKKVEERSIPDPKGLGRGGTVLKAPPGTRVDAAWLDFYREVVKTQAALKERESVLAGLSRQVKEGTPPAAMIRENPLIDRLWERISQLEHRLVQMGDRPDEGDRPNEKEKEELERLRQDLKRYLNLDLAGRELDRKGLEARLRFLQASLQDVAEWSRRRAAYGPVDEYGLEEDVFRRLLLERARLRLQEAVSPSAVPAFFFLEQAVPSTRPLRPRLLFNTLIGAAAGLLSGLSAWLLGRRLDHTLKTPEEAERRLHIPIVGSVSWEEPASLKTPRRKR